MDLLSGWGERHRRLRRGHVKAEALLEIQPHHVAVVRVVADREVLARLEEKVAAAQAEHDRSLHAGRPDDRALEDLAKVVEERVAAVLGRLDQSPVLLAT